jgi:hypothetical protein
VEKMAIVDEVKEYKNQQNKLILNPHLPEVPPLHCESCEADVSPISEYELFLP